MLFNLSCGNLLSMCIMASININTYLVDSVHLAWYHTTLSLLWKNSWPANAVSFPDGSTLWSTYHKMTRGHPSGIQIQISLYGIQFPYTESNSLIGISGRLQFSHQHLYSSSNLSSALVVNPNSLMHQQKAR